MKDKAAKLHVNSSARPLAQKFRGLPFHVREHVAAELNNLEELEIIIERAEGPTHWVSPIVVVPPKKKKKESSRCITTFATHIGLFRYKRLSFGVNSAAEIFQKSIEEVLQGVEGARNISDDIIVFGMNQVDHDEALRAVLQRMRENNLTANPDKCLFNQSSIDFFGRHFSADGISVDEKKISSLIDASPPKNATEARIFFCFGPVPCTLHQGFCIHFRSNPSTHTQKC